MEPFNCDSPPPDADEEANAAEDASGGMEA
jgi:hypothetical protein